MDKATILGFADYLDKNQDKIEMENGYYLPHLDNKCCLAVHAAIYFGIEPQEINGETIVWDVSDDIIGKINPDNVYLAVDPAEGIDMLAEAYGPDEVLGYDEMTIALSELDGTPDDQNHIFHPRGEWDCNPADAFRIIVKKYEEKQEIRQ